MPKTQKINVNEGNDYNFTIVLQESTSGETVSARVRATDASGTGTSVGSASGDLEDTEITLTLGLNSLSPDKYNLEFYADYGGSNQRIVTPNPETTYILKVIDRFGVSN